MKLSFSTLGCPQYDVDQVIRIAKSSGYEGVEIRHIRGEVMLSNLEEFQPHHIAEIRRKFAQSGLEVICINSSIRFTSRDPAEREKQFQAVIDNVEIASTLGAHYIRVFGGPLPNDQDRDEVIRLITEGLNRAVELANRRGVVPLLETHDSFSTGKLCRELLSGIDGRIGVIWDILHSYRHGESFADTVKELGPRIRHVHIKDSANFSPAGFDCKLPGQGKVPITEAVAVLKDVGYNDYLSFEWEKGWHPEIEEPEIALPLYVTFMKRLLS